MTTPLKKAKTGSRVYWPRRWPGDKPAYGTIAFLGATLVTVEWDVGLTATYRRDSRRFRLKG